MRSIDEASRASEVENAAWRSRDDLGGERLGPRPSFSQT